MACGVYDRTKAKPNRGMFKKGHISPCTMLGKHHSKKTKKKMRISHIGLNTWLKGKSLSKDHRVKVIKTLINGDECRGKNNPMYGKVGYWNGKKLTKQHKEKMRQNHVDFKLENHPNWQGGISFEPYPITFNNQLKDKIRARDNFICQKCGVPELECNERLTCHHIDYNKQNCEENNLIALCHSCNTKVNYSREYWTNYFKEKINANNIYFII